MVAPGTALLAQLLEHFGPQALHRYGVSLQRGDGSLDRTLLRRLVFEDPAQRLALEALMHPAIRARTEALALQAAGALPDPCHPVAGRDPLAGKRSTGFWWWTARKRCSSQRLRARDGLDLAQAQAMLAAQASRPERLAAADDVIVNDAEPAALAPKVAALDQIYRTLAHA